MDKQAIASNPFALMMDPAAVVAAMEGSDRLGRLQRRICKPLDKPALGQASDETALYDHAVDDSPELPD
jgi:hypothetical protein